ncbi:AI-2E family transporter [Chroogloeocystis siderophila]|uniref:AI-2E family transporter n=1 Tax=Chroogloeocystis siderophila TaxID=329163 RepID=UPI000A8139A3|nr:AI-2E family transporter [Chroogloeocystis siderophila]
MQPRDGGDTVKFGQWLGLIVLAIALYILWQIRYVVLLIFASVVLATILNRVVRGIQRLRVNRGIAIAITMTVLLALIIGFFAVIVPRIIDQLKEFVVLIPAISDRFRIWYNWLQTVVPGQFFEDINLLNNLAGQLQSLLAQILGNVLLLVNTSLTAILGFLLFFVVTIMLLADPAPYRRILILTFPAFYRRRVDQILCECEAALIGWIKGTLITMFFVALLSFVGLSVLRVPLPLVNAALAGLLEFIPNVGPTLSVFPPALLALLDAPWKAVAVIGLYVVIQQVESLILVPLIMQQEVSLLPVFTILAVVVFASFFGFLGLFLAIPLLIVTQIWLKEVLVKDVLNKWRGKVPRDRKAYLASVDDTKLES